MNIGLIGSGGREHALCKKIHDSKLTNKIVRIVKVNLGLSIMKFLYIFSNMCLKASLFLDL